MPAGLEFRGEGEEGMLNGVRSLVRGTIPPETDPARIRPRNSHSSPGRPREGPLQSERICVVIPTLNERDTIAALVGRLVATRLVETIVVVDDGSDDGTLQVLEDMGNRWPRLVIRRRPIRKGIGSALREGLAVALAVSPANRFAQLDADLSHSPESLEDLMQRDADVVIGSRYVPGGKVVGLSLRRRAISHGANGLSRLLLHLPVRDATSGFRLYSRRAAESIVSGTQTTGFEFFVESVLVAQERHFSFAEAHITFVGREAGRSKFRGEDILDFLRFLVKAGIRHGISSKGRDAK